MNEYLILRHLHMTLVAISVFSFVFRWSLSLNRSPMLQRHWIRIIPHINDTLLLLSALALCVIIKQYPFVSGWLTAKLLLLVGYVIAGSFAIKRSKTQRGRIIAGVIALLLVFQMIGVAINHSVAGWWGHLG